MHVAGDSLGAMKLLVALAFVLACAPEPKASRVEVAPLPTPSTGETQTKAAPGGGGGPPGDDMRLVVQGQMADRDGDGVPDDLDKCPDAPEDRDGFEDDDGCPDPDNDGDGILDINDKCPNDPGPPPDGCPKPKKRP
jgi:hypothetical protein